MQWYLHAIRSSDNPARTLAIADRPGGQKYLAARFSKNLSGHIGTCSDDTASVKTTQARSSAIAQTENTFPLNSCVRVSAAQATSCPSFHLGVLANVCIHFASQRGQSNLTILVCKIICAKPRVPRSIFLVFRQAGSLYKARGLSAAHNNC